MVTTEDLERGPVLPPATQTPNRENVGMAWALPDIAAVLIDAPSIVRRVRELGALISSDYAGHDLLLVGLLRGTMCFMADLQRAIDIPCQIDYLSVASYGPRARSNGSVRFM